MGTSTSRLHRLAALLARLPGGWLFWLLALGTALPVLAHLDAVPIWDGWAFFRRCYQGAAETGDLRCFGHSAFVPSALFGLTQWVDNGNQVLVSMLNLALGLVAIGWLRASLGALAPVRLSTTERTLLAFALGLNPVFQAQLLQPSLDFPLAILFPGLLLALLRRRHGWAALAGLGLVFSKEPGVVLYGAAVLFYLLLLAFAPPRRLGWRTLFADRLPVLALPAVAVVGYVLLFPPQSDAGSWEHVLRSLVRIDLHSTFLHTQLFDAFALQFTWVASLLASVGLLARPLLVRWRRQRGEPLPAGVYPLRAVGFLLLTLLGLGYLLTRIPFANNPRYVLPLLPLLLLLLGHALVWLGPRTLRVLVLLGLLGLYGLSITKTIDPVSRAFYGTWRFGEHELLDMTQPANRWLCEKGRDQLVYNLQFLRFGPLTEQVVRAHGLGAVYVADWRMTWNAFEDLRSFDARTLRRTLRRGPGTVEIILVEHTDFARLFPRPDLMPLEIFFIAYPNMRNTDALEGYLKHYVRAGSERFEDDGYALEVVRLRRRQSAP